MDSIVESVITKFQKRSEFGRQKYGTTLDRNDLSIEQWLVHAQEEAMDFVLYLEKLKKLLGAVQEQHVHEKDASSPLCTSFEGTQRYRWFQDE